MSIKTHFLKLYQDALGFLPSTLHKKLERRYHQYIRALPYQWRYLRSLQRNHWKTKTVLCYPERPISTDVIYKMCCVLGYTI